MKFWVMHIAKLPLDLYIYKNKNKKKTTPRPIKVKFTASILDKEQTHNLLLLISSRKIRGTFIYPVKTE